MKRIMYISTTTRKLSDEEVEAIGRKSTLNNAKVGVTGVLLSANEFFFQILEGNEVDVAGVMDRIKKDPRHKGLLILKAENNVTDRLFGDWSMNTVRLDGMSDMLMQAIRIMLENITDSHRVIERYTQPAVLKFMMEGVNPLTVPVNKTEQVIVFGDIVAFSYLSGLFPVEEVANIVNLFLDISSKEISRRGGQVTKYVGDCVVAHFPADRADDAIRSCVETIVQIKRIRESSVDECRLQRFLYCGFGISKGMVIEGNIGSSIKMDYTVLGDIVNLAARLESLTREIGKCIALSESVKDACKEPWDFLNAGSFLLKGQGSEQPVFTVSDLAVNDMKNYDELSKLVGEGGCEVKW
jgi:class 3 adenylate cyclase